MQVSPQGLGSRYVQVWPLSKQKKSFYFWRFFKSAGGFFSSSFQSHRLQGFLFININICQQTPAALRDTVTLTYAQLSVGPRMIPQTAPALCGTPYDTSYSPSSVCGAPYGSMVHSLTTPAVCGTPYGTSSRSVRGTL